MSSATPDLQLPSPWQSITALLPVPNYTAWWQRHNGCWQLAPVRRPGVEPATSRSRVRHANQNTTKQPKCIRVCIVLACFPFTVRCRCAVVSEKREYEWTLRGVPVVLYPVPVSWPWLRWRHLVAGGHAQWRRRSLSGHGDDRLLEPRHRPTGSDIHNTLSFAEIFKIHDKILAVESN